MLAAHLVPGYFAAVKSQPNWPIEWNRNKRIVLWTVALASTYLPDADLFYNGLLRRRLVHSIPWTDSLFVYLGIGVIWLTIRQIGRWPYAQTLVGLVTFDALSHLFLDMISHGTALLYPFSTQIIGFPWSSRVLGHGMTAYITDPIFLLEVLLITAAIAHWITTWDAATTFKKAALSVLASGFVLFNVAFLVFLPTLQNIAAAYRRHGLN